MDAYGILGVLAITKDESVLVAVTGVLSVGQLYGADILKITNVEFISLRTFGSVENVDSRIVDVSRTFFDRSVICVIPASTFTLITNVLFLFTSIL